MPTDRLTPGLTAAIVTTVDDKLIVKHMGGDGVMSTPSMIGLMERAGIEAVQAYLPEGHTTVGFEVNVKHFGATPKGQKVTVRAELLEVDGRKLKFKVEAHDQDKKVGDGAGMLGACRPSNPARPPRELPRKLRIITAIAAGCVIVCAWLEPMRSPTMSC